MKTLLHLALLVGAWKLVSVTARDSGGNVSYPLGTNAQGVLTYHDNGRMAVQIMNPDRAKFASNDPQLTTEPEVRAAFDGYVAYYGTYTVKPDEGIVVHHVDGALIPNWVGSDQVRHFKLDGNRLTISGPLKLGGVDQTMSLVWERLP